jgi:hypothetical protein
MVSDPKMGELLHVTSSTPHIPVKVRGWNILEHWNHPEGIVELIVTRRLSDDHIEAYNPAQLARVRDIYG